MMQNECKNCFGCAFEFRRRGSDADTKFADDQTVIRTGLHTHELGLNNASLYCLMIGHRCILSSICLCIRLARRMCLFDERVSFEGGADPNQDRERADVDAPALSVAHLRAEARHHQSIRQLSYVTPPWRRCCQHCACASRESGFCTRAKPTLEKTPTCL